MRTLKIGKSNLDASVIALGTWAFGGWMWGGADEKKAIEATHAALDAGINFIDTAPIYGFGLSEEITGKAIEGRRDKVILATKCGLVASSTALNNVGKLKFNSTAAGFSLTGQIGVYINQSPASIREEIEGSLKRLRTDYIDLYQTHWQEKTTPKEETMATLMELKKEGKIRAIGASNATSGDMNRYIKSGELDCDQECYSMVHRRIEKDQLPFCHKKNISVLAYSPLSNGLLTGKIGPERTFNDGDLRNDNPVFSIENRKRILTMFANLAPIMETHKITPAQLAIAWALHQPGLTHTLCGARNPRQAIENAVAGDVILNAEELATIEDELKNIQEQTK